MDQADEVRKQILDHIKYLEFENALDLMITNNFPLDSFIDDFKILYTLFKKKKSFLLAQNLAHLFSLIGDNAYTKAILELWKKDIYSIINEELQNNPLNLIKGGGYTPLIKFFLKDEVIAKDFIKNFVKVTDKLVEDPNNKPILSFLLEINEALLNSGNLSAGKIINSWIQAAVQLRKSTLDPASILHIFKESEGSFAPLSLLKNFFETSYKENNYRANANTLNKFSEFLDEIEPIIYDLPNKSIKGELLKLIDGFYSTIASGFEFIIFDRMRHQSIDQILSAGPSAANLVVRNLTANLSPKNPLPVTRCLEFIMEEWRNFPRLSKTEYDFYTRRSTIREIRPLFWFIVFQLIFSSHFTATYQRLLKNETIHQRNLVELVRVNLNLFYHISEYTKSDSAITHQDKKKLEEDLIKYLKKMNDMMHFSDDELREIVNSSYWKDLSSDILSKAIEAKNYCIYCSYNMPPGAETCPNCGHDATSAPTEEPPIDFTAMGSFFSSSPSPATTSSVNSPTPASSPDSDSTSSPSKIRICPRCGSPLSAVENRCVNCNYQVG